MSAIDDLMATLTPQGPMPAVMSSQMPQFTPPPINNPHKNLLQRVVGNLGGLLGGAAGGISDIVRPHTPGGYEGLLSDEEVQNARPGFLQSLLSSKAGNNYTSDLNHLLELKMLKQKMGDAQAQKAKDAQHEALRAEVGQTLSDTSVPQAERFARLHKLFGVAFEIGDDKSMGAISNVIGANKPNDPTAKQYEPQAFTLNGNIVWVRPGETPPPGAKPYSKPTESQPILVTGTNADGSPTFGLVNKGTGQATPVSGVTPKVATGSSSAQNAASEALLRSSVSEMGNADKFMREYEQGLKDKKYSINGLSQFLGGLGNAFTHDDPASRAIQNTALTALNKTNPDLARYIRRGLSFAEGEAGISKRPSDFRTKMATFLSTVASGASDPMIDDIQGRRSSILTPLHDVVGRMGGSTSKGSGSVTGAAQSYEDWKKAHGH